MVKWWLAWFDLYMPSWAIDIAVKYEEFITIESYKSGININYKYKKRQKVN